MNKPDFYGYLESEICNIIIRSKFFRISSVTEKFNQVDRVISNSTVILLTNNCSSSRIKTMERRPTTIFWCLYNWLLPTG